MNVIARTSSSSSPDFSAYTWIQQCGRPTTFVGKVHSQLGSLGSTLLGIAFFMGILIPYHIVRFFSCKKAILSHRTGDLVPEFYDWTCKNVSYQMYRWSTSCFPNENRLNSELKICTASSFITQDACGVFIHIPGNLQTLGFTGTQKILNALQEDMKSLTQDVGCYIGDRDAEEWQTGLDIGVLHTSLPEHPVSLIIKKQIKPVFLEKSLKERRQDAQ